MVKLSFSVLALALSSACFAQGFRAPPVGEVERVSFAYADVLRSDPVVERIDQARPREVCRNVTTSRGTRYDNTNAGTVVGALVGGALGNQAGKGDGRKAATIAGAVIGGLAGREIDSNNNPRGVRHSTQTECDVVDEVVQRQEVVGYDVQYRYRGEVYFSRLSYDPGEKLRIRVAVAPAEL